MNPTKSEQVPNNVTTGAKVPVNPEQQMGQLMELAISHHASDLHMTVGVKPSIRIDGTLHPVGDHPVLTPDRLEGLVYSIINAKQKKLLVENRELDFSVTYQEKARFRGNAFYQRDYLGLALRLIPNLISSYEELNLPGQIRGYAKMKQGLVLCRSNRSR